MKVIVVRQDGRSELLTLVPPLAFKDGGEFYSGIILCGDGTEHYFHNDGTYDGWGRCVDMSMEEAKEEIQRMESGRQVGDMPQEGMEG